MLFDAVSHIRRFQRAVTTEVGALDASFLGRGRPLGPARVINAIGNGKTQVGEIRAYLGLDSGLMSRILRTLEGEGLITMGTSAEDSRRRQVRLTEAGQREFAAYEALADARAQSILARHPKPARLLEAMDIVANAFGRGRFCLLEVVPGDARAQACMAAYYRELAVRFTDGYEVARSSDPEQSDLRRPRGAFLLALSDDLAIGCAGLKGTDKGYAEVKRVWVAPEARGLGVSHLLMQRIEQIARELGISLLRLDTNSALPEAVAFYRKNGWSEIPRFNDDPYPDLFFEKSLSAP